MRSYWIRVAPNSVTGILNKRIGGRETHLEHQVMMEAHSAGSQRMPQIAGNYQKLGEWHEADSPLEPPEEGTNLANTLI